MQFIIITVVDRVWYNIPRDTETQVRSYYHRTTFLQFHLVTSILPQSP